MPLTNRKQRHLIHDARMCMTDPAAQNLLRLLADELEKAVQQLPEREWGAKDSDTGAIYLFPGEANARRVAELNAPQLIVVRRFSTEWVED